MTVLGMTGAYAPEFWRTSRRGMNHRLQELSPGFPPQAQLAQAVTDRLDDTLLTTLLSETADAIFVKDLAGRYVLMNPSACRMIGRPADQMIGKTALELFGQEGRSIQERDEAVLREGLPRTFVETVVLDGVTRTWESTRTPYRDGSGALVGLVGVAREVTALTRTEHERDQLLQALEESHRSRDEFLAIAAHELRSPLSALRLQLELTHKHLVAKGAGTDPALLEWVTGRVAGAERSLARLNRHLDTLLDVSQIASGSFDLTLESFDLATLAHEIAHRYGDEVAQAGCTLELSARAAPGRWDRARLDQVITNLVTNAIKYGSGQPIRMDVRSGAHWVTLKVCDRGIGIPKEFQKLVFHRFQRAPTRRQFAGLGLGLWIADAIVKAHGGRISVRSIPGKGSIFQVKLPRDPSAATGA